MMNNKFIDKLMSDFDIQVELSIRPILGKNTFALDEYENIRSLRLDSVNLKNLHVLTPIAETVTELSLEDCSLNELNHLKEFSKLEKLNLSINPIPQSSYEDLAYLSNLKELDVSVTHLSDTRPIGYIKQLEMLELSGNDRLHEIKGLEGLESLKCLKLNSHEINDLKKISLHKNIESIILRNGNIGKIHGLEKYPNLIELDFSSNPIPKITGLDNLKFLKRLILHSTWVKKIEHLDNLGKLEELDLAQNGLKKIEGLENLYKLKKLNLSLNKIRKVENLDTLSKLEYLLLECNDITDFDPTFLQTLKSKCFMSLVGNPLCELKLKIPDHIIIQFEDENWIPKRL